LFITKNYIFKPILIPSTDPNAIIRCIWC